MRNDKNTHVYCTNCKLGKELILSINENKEIPLKCNECHPFNPEDSVTLDWRPMYELAKE